MFHTALLRNTARAYGLQCSYKNVEGEVIWSPEKTLVKMIEDLSGKKIKSDDDLKNLFEERARLFQDENINPCQVFWGGTPKKIQIRSTHSLENTLSAKTLDNETIEIYKVSERKTSHGFKALYEFKKHFPIGYHTLKIKIEGNERQTLVICPPEKISINQKKSWGPFVPLYAIKSKNDWGIGSFKEGVEIAQKLSPYGAKWMGLLPMLAGNFDHPDCDPSPYSSLTRLFWNEIYLDVESLVKKYANEEAKRLISTPAFQSELNALREKSHVDYYGVYQLKKKVLLILSNAFFERRLDTQTEYLNFKNENPEIDAYAKFRSSDICQQNFHRFVQFEMNNTMRVFSNENNFGLYMDYPVGVNDSGFDYKEFRSVFYGEVSVGAPPEPVFALGQDWGFPAFHPRGMQKDGYQYFRKSLKHHLKFCKILRLDHIMGLHRIYSVPKNFKGNEGVYLRFPPEELFAVVILEAHIAGADLIGENLGTVPEAVDKIIKERNLNGMWVLECETWRSVDESFLAMKPNSLACLNTHDMPMIAAYRKGTDLDLVESLKILSTDYKIQFQKARKLQIAEWEKSLAKNLALDNFIESAVAKIAESKAQYFVLNLEDLWGEEMPQNIPGTWKEYPNWRKKFSHDLEVWTELKTVKKVFTSLKEFRGN